MKVVPITDSLTYVLDMNSQGFRGITKLIAMTLVKYKDEKSQSLVNELIIAMCRNNSDFSLEHFNTVFKALCTKELINAPPAKASVAAIVALNWTVSIAIHCNRSSSVGKSEYPRLIEYQSILYTLSLQTSNSKHVEKAYECLKNYWSQQLEVNDADILNWYFEKFNSMEPTHYTFITLLAILRYYLEEKCDHSFIESKRQNYLNHFTKGLITVKTKIDCHLYDVSGIYLNLMTEEEAKINLLPAIQRAMLRSPENILEGVEYIIQGLQFNIDEHGFEIGKVLVQNLHSKVDLNRTYSVNGLKQLALKCSSQKSIEAMLQNIFAILNGSEGKITVAEYRISLLQVSIVFNTLPQYDFLLKYF